MNIEQTIRLEVIRLLLSQNISAQTALYFAAKISEFVLSGKTPDSVSMTDPAKFVSENPLRIKINASTGIPAEFS